MSSSIATSESELALSNSLLLEGVKAPSPEESFLLSSNLIVSEKFCITISNIVYIDWIVGALQIVARIPASSTEIQLYFVTATVNTQFLASAMDSSDSRISFSATYQTLT